MNRTRKMIFTCIAVAALIAVAADAASATTAEEKCEPAAGLSRESAAPDLLRLPVMLFRECPGTKYENMPARRSAHAKAKKRHPQKTYFNLAARAPVFRPMIVLGVAW